MTLEPRARWRDAVSEDAEAMSALGLEDDVSCPPADLVQASFARTLPPHLQERIAAHVAQCAICQTLGAALEDESVSSPTRDERERVGGRLRAAIAQQKREARYRRLWRWSAAPAAIAIAGFGALRFWPDTHDLRFQAPEPELRTQGQPAAQSVFRLEKAELLSLAPAGRPRFAPADPGEMSDLTEALAPYENGNFGEAIQRLRTLANRRPRSGPAQFYLGLTRVHEGYDFWAVPNLEFAQRAARAATPDLVSSTSWYLALVFVRVGQVDRARPLLNALCESPGDFARRACDGLQELSRPIRFSGIVTGPNGEPLSDVTVGQHVFRSEDIYLVTDPTRLSASTDGYGKYTVAGLPLSLGRRAIIRAAKPGYFTRTVGVELGRDLLADFRLVPWTALRLGAVVSGTVTVDDTPGGHPNERFDEFALTVPGNGTIEVSVEAPGRPVMDLYVEAPGGEVYGPQEGEPMRLDLPARAGSTFQLRVLNFSRTPQPYKLTTLLK